MDKKERLELMKLYVALEQELAKLMINSEQIKNNTQTLISLVSNLNDTYDKLFQSIDDEFTELKFCTFIAKVTRKMQVQNQTINHFE